MARLIDVDALLGTLSDIITELPVPIESYIEGLRDGLDRACEIIEQAPTIDAIPVVRCKGCRWAREKDHREPTDTPGELICQCFKHHYIPAPWGARMAVCKEDYCSYGEKKSPGGDEDKI